MDGVDSCDGGQASPSTASTTLLKTLDGHSLQWRQLYAGSRPLFLADVALNLLDYLKVNDNALFVPCHDNHNEHPHIINLFDFS